MPTVRLKIVVHWFVFVVGMSKRRFANPLNGLDLQLNHKLFGTGSIMGWVT